MGKGVGVEKVVVGEGRLRHVMMALRISIIKFEEVIKNITEKLCV